MKNFFGSRKNLFKIGMMLILMSVIISCSSSGGFGDPPAGAPAITSLGNCAFTKGVAGSFTVTATGDPAPTFSLSGDLPDGVTFNNSTGTLSGTPTGDTNGTYPITITASNGVPPDAIYGLTLYYVGDPSTAALIVHGNVEYLSLPHLADIMTAAGFTVAQSNGVPAGDLRYAQIWDVRFNKALTSDDIASYTAYLQSGRTLVLIGENRDFMTRNNSISSFISGIGGGSVTVINETFDPETVQTPFNTPSAVTTVAFQRSGYTGSTGNGAFITQRDATQGSSLYFASGTLSGAAAGRLMVVFDADFLSGLYSPTTDDALIDNMVRLP